MIGDAASRLDQGQQFCVSWRILGHSRIRTATRDGVTNGQICPGRRGDAYACLKSREREFMQ